MSDLIIGSGSQLAYYLVGTHVSSRDIPYKAITRRKWNRIYLCFAEQRTFIDNDDSFMKINYDLTKEVIDKLDNYCNEFVFYSTALLWSGNKGSYDISTPYSYQETDYLVSKQKITDYLKNIDKVSVHYPCNFNSKNRKGGFLFASLYDIISKREKVEVRCLDFEKEIAHAKYIATKSMNTHGNCILAPGFSVNVRTLFSNILSAVDMSLEDYVKETECDDFVKPNNYYHRVKDVAYDNHDLVASFVEELK